MPIYEYLCNDCNVVFSFISRQVGPLSTPVCPRCSSESMIKQLSSFTSPSPKSGGEGGIDEESVERGFSNLLQEAEQLPESDASQVGNLMESFAKESGYGYSQSLKNILQGASFESGRAAAVAHKELLIQTTNGSVAVNKGVVGRADPEIDPNIYQL